MARLLCSLIVLCFLITSLPAQTPMAVPPGGGNKKASVSERIGITDVTIYYNRPAVKNREGKIWGQLVAYGFTDLGFGTSKAAPWRAGANENTTIQFTTGVKIEGQPLSAGLYGFHIAVGADECTLIFSKNATSWGSFFYDEKEDALRVKVKPLVTDRSIEWLKYEFMNQTDSSAVIALLWEKLTIPFRVEVDYVKTQLESFRRELRTDKGFSWQAWQQAALFCAQNSTNLEEGLTWAETSISNQFFSDENFLTLSTKAQILNKLNRAAEADAIMKEALPLGKTPEIHAYARQLLAQKRTKEAFDAFKLNYDKHPAEFTTMVGMMRAYSATGDHKKALVFARKALPLAPDKVNKDNISNMITTLEQGKDIN